MKWMKPVVFRMGSFISTCATITALVTGLFVIAAMTAQSQTPTGRAQGFTFALVGDLGYSSEEEPLVENVFADLDRDTSLAFVVHVGDLSAPRFSCQNELRARRLAQFRASAHPLVYTPGDNDWTDCHEPAVKGGDPLERLANLRTVFYEGGQTLGQRTLPLTRQSQSEDPGMAKYRENARWDLAGVTFLTLHVVGSNNGLGRTPEGDAEYFDRNKANLAWLKEGFAHANANNSRAIMIMQQANIFPEFPPFPDKPKDPSGYTDLREQLQKEAVAFGKPVVLVHGDSHFFRVDKPLSPMRERGKPVTTALEHFTRLETFGSPYHHWVHVTVEADDPQVFTFRQRIVGSNVSKR